ncbi:hypothetical protein AMTR_s00020p00247570 [Amborella trichopoda]|uniref:Uncharacterized protein n=1 Tax=Amborella trichopoda TaxID=13333 RepID=W1PW27_AMBTC|nr:hypothetical protein AMTR_s00020p00247570 [Amborella trichopoda]
MPGTPLLCGQQPLLFPTHTMPWGVPPLLTPRHLSATCPRRRLLPRVSLPLLTLDSWPYPGPSATSCFASAPFITCSPPLTSFCQPSLSIQINRASQFARGRPKPPDKRSLLSANPVGDTRLTSTLKIPTQLLTSPLTFYLLSLLLPRTTQPSLNPHPSPSLPSHPDKRVTSSRYQPPSFNAPAGSSGLVSHPHDDPPSSSGYTPLSFLIFCPLLPFLPLPSTAPIHSPPSLVVAHLSVAATRKPCWGHMTDFDSQDPNPAPYISLDLLSPLSLAA